MLDVSGNFIGRSLIMKDNQRTLLYSYSLLLALVICFASCTRTEIEITPEYIYNNNWSQSSNSIDISLLKLKPNGTLDLNSLNQGDVVDNLEMDSSFRYFTNVKRSQVSTGKIYFNKDNGFSWANDKKTTNVIGNLKRNSWYRFAIDSYQNKIYIFIDSLNSVHKQEVVPTNY